MENTLFDRRKFMTMTTKAATGVALLSTLPKTTMAETHIEPKIKFSVININHNHIYGMTDAVTRGGGQLVSFYAKEPDLVAAFSKKYPQAKGLNDGTDADQKKITDGGKVFFHFMFFVGATHPQQFNNMPERVFLKYVEVYSKCLSNHFQPRISRIYTNFSHQTSNLCALCVISTGSIQAFVVS